MLVFSTVRGHAEVRVELQMERWAARGGSVRLRCVHDVPPHLLDKVVFLRHGTKIFQYIRDRKPPYRNFTTPGAVLNRIFNGKHLLNMKALKRRLRCSTVYCVPL
ncbi:hypothetical protein PYW08_002153 [Mythimna loreyi]|uniref:Uncharacterized protein n=1 Tax=Mythimna loreyi TaxID=667449 RepID=A0ACC2R0Z2_9NEOP|nr:hypothetical protein PYW08_002153 [Mythimna loreyi]